MVDVPRCISCGNYTDQPMTVTTSRFKGPYCPDCAMNEARKSMYDRAAAGSKDFRHTREELPGIDRYPFAGMYDDMRKKGRMRPWRERS